VEGEEIGSLKGIKARSRKRPRGYLFMQGIFQKLFSLQFVDVVVVVDVLVDVDVPFCFFSPARLSHPSSPGDLLDYARRRVYSGGFSHGGFPCQGP
jgi:hypothetical protein